MDIFIQQLINSLSVASVIILIGMGITLIFGLTGSSISPMANS